jgi:hypothetical protein
MKTKLQESYKCNCPNINRIKEKELKLLQHPLAVLEISIIFFPTKASQKVRRHNLPHNSTLKCYRQQAIKSITLGITRTTQSN